MFRHAYDPLSRCTPIQLVRVAQRLEEVMRDASRPEWLRNLASQKRMEARSFARIGFLKQS